MRLLRLLMVAALVAVGVACSGDDGPGPGEARLTVDGRAVVLADGEESVETGTRELSTGDEVRITRGTATLELPGEVMLELREGRGGRRGSRVRVDDVPELLAGDLLARSGPSTAARVESQGGRSVFEGGAGRLSRGLTLTTAFYSGRGRLISGTERPDLEALFQVSVPGVGLVSAPRPLRVDRSDPWDRRMLGDAIQLSDELQQRSAGFTGQVGPGAQRSGFYLTRFDGLSEQASFPTLFSRTRRPAGETLVGLSITMLGRKGSFAERWERVFSFRAAGAEWGLVARREGVAREPLLERVDRAIAGSAGELAIATGGTGGGGSSPDGTTPGTTPPGGGSSSGPSPSPSPGPSPGPSPSPPPPSPPPDENGPLPDEPDGPLPETGTPVDDILQPVDDVADDADDVVGDILGGVGDSVSALP